MIKIIGYENKQGSFSNKETGEIIEYDNIILHCITDEKEELVGMMAMSHKARKADLKIVGAKTLDETINKEVYLITDLTGKADENGKIKNLIAKIIVVG